MAENAQTADGNGVAVFVGAGANLGDRAEALRLALDAVRAIPGTWAWRCSPWYETPPVEVVAAPDEAVPPFLNAVFAGVTSLAPRQMLAALQAIEHGAGRTDKGGHRSRTLDLDLLALGSTVLAEPGLTLPHPRLAERWFVLQPLCDLAPAWQHPQSGLRAAQLLEVLESRGDDEMIGRGWRYADEGSA